MLPAVNHLEDLAEPLERFPLTAERHDIPLEKGNDLFAEHARGRHFIHQDLRISGLGVDPSTLERCLGELEDPAAALVLIQKEVWINVVPRPACRMRLDAHRKRTFAFDEARKEPLGRFSAWESFLLIVRTRHVVTIVDAPRDKAVTKASR